MPESDPNSDVRTSESLIRELERMRDVLCAGCKKPLGSHQMLMAMALGFKNVPRCVLCSGAVLACDPASLRDSLLDYVHQRQCYSDAWNWANRDSGLPQGALPHALLALGAPKPNAVPNDLPNRSELPQQVASFWDAGDQGCGELVLELRLRLQKMEPDQVLQLTARDLGAPEDLPAWCRLTGQSLLRAAHPHYWIQRKR